MSLKNYLIIAIFFSFLQLRASLMMSIDELNQLDQIAPLEEIDIPKDNSINISDFSISSTNNILFLSAILYFSPSRWTVWVNDKTYTADDTEDATIKITKVQNHYIVFTLKNAANKSFKLRANQSLIVGEQNIIEGDARQKKSGSAQL